MRRYMSVKRLGALVLAAVLSVSAAFVSEAAASYKAEVPVTLHLDVNSRRTTIYDGYSSYLLGYRVSEYDTFTVTKDKSDVDLNEVTLNYYLVTYRGETQKYLECTVYGLKEGTHYHVYKRQEILLTSMDCDGTRNGYDNELTSLIASHVSVPVIASGGAGNKEHFYDALTKGGADAALAASLFHYKELEIRDLKKYLWAVSYTHLSFFIFNKLLPGNHGSKQNRVF